MADLKGVSLTLLMGPVRAPAPAAVVQAVESVQVTRAVGQRSGFQISFAYSSRSPIATQLLPAGYFDPLMRVILVATLNGLPCVMADGPIKRQDVTASARPGEHRLTITGEDITGYMDLIEVKGFPYPSLPPFARVAAMLRKYAGLGVIPTTIPTPFSFAESLTEKTPSQQGTDYQYAKALAEEAGYEFYVTPGPLPGANKVYWGPQVRVGVPQPAITIDMNQASNIESLAFTADGNAAEITYGHVKIANVSVPVPMPSVSLLRPPLSARPLISTKLKSLQTERKSEAAVLEALLAGGARAEPLSATGAMDLARYGSPLDARQLVGVRGAGLAHDGLWYVRQVTHSLGRGSWKQNFQLSRDGLISNVPMVRP